MVDSSAPAERSVAPSRRVGVGSKKRTLTGRLLVVHANIKSYGVGAAGPKASNRDFAFAARDYDAMRDSGRPYSGNPAKNKLLPLPRPTYTEFVNRAKRAKCLDRLDFMFCSPEAMALPRIDYSAYEVVVYSGVSFRRFARIWTPERHHFFAREFQDRARCFVLCLGRLRVTATRGLPADCLEAIIAFSASKKEIRDGYDDHDTVAYSNARHLFLPAPGSSGVREALFDAIFGLA